MESLKIIRYQVRLKSLIKKTARNGVVSINNTIQAKDDLKSIARYTQEIWGREQRNKYLGILDNCFHLLADKPDLGETYDEIRKGYRKLDIERRLLT